METDLFFAAGWLLMGAITLLVVVLIYAVALSDVRASMVVFELDETAVVDGLGGEAADPAATPSLNRVSKLTAARFWGSK